MDAEQSGPSVPSPSLFGRHAELDLVATFVTDAAAGGGALLLSGDPGVGKTALLDAAGEAARAAGVRVLRTEGVEFLTDLDFAGLSRILLPVRDLLPRMARAQRDALTQVMGFGTHRVAHRLLVFNAVLDLLREAAVDRPVLVVVDDLHRIDRASAAAFAFVARRSTGSRVGFLAATAPELGVVPGIGVPEHRVAPLDDRAAAALLDTHFPLLAARVSRRVLAEARGNPLALLKLPLALTEPQRTGRRPLPSVLPLITPLSALFASRLAELPDETRRLLLLAALEGSGDVGTVTAAADRRVLDDFAPAERAQLVLVDLRAGRVDFCHPLIRCAVVDRATGPERRWAHRALADLLADRPEHRARHLAEAATEPDDQVADLLERAAPVTLSRGDAVGAVATLLRAAELSPSGPARGRRFALAAHVGVAVAGDLRRVPELLALAAVAGPADPGHGRPLYATVAAARFLLHRDGDVAGAHRLLVEALMGERLDSAGAALDEALHLLFEVCTYGGSAEMWSAFHALLARVPSVSPDLRLLVAFVADPARLSGVDVECLHTGIRGLCAETDPTSIVRVSTAALVADRGADSRAALWGAVGSGREGNAITAAVNALTLLCVDDVLTGRWDECTRLAEEGVGMCTDHGYRLPAARLRLVRALVAAARGDRDSVRAVTDEVLGWAEPRGLAAVTRYAHRVSTLAALTEDDAETAYRHATAISPAGTLSPRDAPASWAALDLVEAAVLTGRREEARRHVEAMRAMPLHLVSPRFAMVTAGAAALSASPGRSATDLYEAALATPGGERWAFDHARIELAYGMHLRRRRETGPARRHLRTALATFRWLAADPWARRARDELRTTGLHFEAARPAAGRRPRLTPEEHEAAALAATGLTNKQIAQRLHLSHRTVAARLHQAFPKLGVASRAGLRDALADRSAPVHPDSSAS